MKKVNFKKWIVISIASFILSLVFLGVSVFSGGASIIRALSHMDNWFDDGFSMVAGGMMNDDWSVISDTNNGSIIMDDDVAEYQLASSLQSFAILETIQTKEQLDTYLQQVATEANTLTLTANDKENLIDAVEENVNFNFDTTPVPTDGLATDDYEDYFERNQLSNRECSDYIEATLKTLLK